LAIEGEITVLSELPVAWPANALIVDGDAAARTRIASTLTAYRVETAESIYDAVPLVRCARPLHLAFVEFDLVDGCGVALLRELCDFQPGAARILISTRDSVRRFQATIAAHVFVSKPLNGPVLRALARARLESSLNTDR
jgi:response regulator RpfG family c-di-GMP phosphodiesterase